MHRTHKALATLALGLALVAATTATAAATPDQSAQRKALYQSELERNLQQRTQADNQVAVGQRLAAQRKALYQSELERNLARQRAQADNQVAVGHGLVAQRKALYQSELERNLATAAAADRAATRPSAQIDPAPGPGVDVVATLLVGLVGGLVGGAAAMIGWTATTRRRRPRAAAGT
jgi:hypothetical protein